MANFRPNVALLLLDPKSRVLVCEREKIADSWQFPQGGVDKGESLVEALYREVEEEIGLPPTAYKVGESRDGYRYFYPEQVRKRKKGGFAGQEQTYYLCRLKKNAPPINVDQKPREFRSYRWLKPASFELSWVPEFKRKVYQQVMKDFFGVKIR